MQNKIIIILSMFSYTTALPVVYGSLTAPSVQALITFPSGDATNQMEGFGAFTAGFTLTNATTSCLFTSLFPVSGPISLNGGTLNLSNSMILDSAANIKSAGIINGSNYQLVLPGTMSAYQLPSTTMTWGLTLNGVNLVMQSDVSLNVPLTIQGICEIQGNGYALTINNATGISIASGASLLMQNVVVKNVSGTKISFAATTSQLLLHDVIWWLTANTTLTTGYFNVIDSWFINGGYTLTYNSSQTSTIASNSQIMMGYGSTFNYSPSNTSQNLLAFTDNTSKLFLNSATLSASSVGLVLTNGNLIIDGKSYITSTGTTAATGILFGNNVSANDLIIEVMPGANVQLGGYVGYNNVN